MTDTIHCLKCDAEYNEQSPIVEVCPKCGNTDKQQTVYLMPDIMTTEDLGEAP